MRLRKQSMREVADAGMVSRIEANRDPYGDIIRADMSDHQQIDDKPRYFRGALIKPKPETKTHGK